MPLCDPRALARQSGLPLAEIRLLVEHVTGIARTHWLADPQQTISQTHEHELDVMLARRAAGEPVAYLLGNAEFYGRVFEVCPDVLIPRPETEELVEAVLAELSELRELSDRSIAGSPSTSTLSVLDVGTGSGVIAITLALEYPALRVYACDVSVAALAVATRNATRLKAHVQLRPSNWLAAFEPHEQFDLIVSNPPYIMAGDCHLTQGDLRFEPAVALTDHADGLTAYTELAKACKTHLRPGGSLWVEHGWHQQADIVRIFEQAGLVNVSGLKDLSGHARMVRADKPAD